MSDTIFDPTMEPLFFSLDPMSLILSQNSDTHQLKLLLDNFYGFERGPRYDEYSRLRESKIRMRLDFQRILDDEEEDEEPRKKQVRFEGSSVISLEEEISPEKKRQTQVRLEGSSVISGDEEISPEKKKQTQVRFEGRSVISRQEEIPPNKKQVRFEGISVVSREEEISPEKKKQTQVRLEGNSVISPEKKQKRFGFSPMSNPRKPPSSLAQSVPDFSSLIRKENRRPSNFNTTPPPPSKTRNAAVLTRSPSPATTAARGSKSASVGEKKSKSFMGLSRKSYANVEDLKKISMAAASAINGGGERKGGGRNILGYRKIY